MEPASPPKSVLMICGDYMEDCEVIVPFYTLRSLGINVDCVSLGKSSVYTCVTAIHDYQGFELYTELQGHSFILNSDFATSRSESYDALIIPGGRFTEPLSTHRDTLAMVARFAELGKPIVAMCHSQLVLVAAGVVNGTKCTAFPSLEVAVTLAGGLWVSPYPIESCVVDRNFITAIGWPANANVIRALLESMGAQVHGPKDRSVLLLVGDFVEDYEANVPFQALGALGCNVEAVSPTKKKGDWCITAVQDLGRGEVCSELRGHNFVTTMDWTSVDVESFDCLVVPGGRSPEILVGNEKAVSLVKEFVDRGKVVAGLGQGLLVFVAAGILKGKKCASNVGMKVMVELAGGKVESTESVVDGQLLTAAGWPSLPSFLSDLITLLGLTVTFH